MDVLCETANAGLPTVEMGQSRLNRAGSSFGHVGYPLIAIDFYGACNFVMCHEETSARINLLGLLARNPSAQFPALRSAYPSVGAVGASLDAR
jgi:hypothetical protein